jgi:NAD(P)-dependent dehydrogenase (short-subunit alcohol dehydrogenase family)
VLALVVVEHSQLDGGTRSRRISLKERRAVAIAFAKEGADIAFLYLDEEGDAEETREMIEEEGRQCLLVNGDIGEEKLCRNAIRLAVEKFGRIDILVNNAAEQHVEEDFEKLDSAKMERTFRTNVFAMFYLTKAAVPHMREGSAIVNSTSVTAYRGSARLIDYAATKGAIVSFTRSLSSALVEKGIRVNAVAPGPVWTPLIPASFPADQVADFGKHVPMGRPGQPEEIAPSYVFLASSDSSYMTGQVLHPNGGEVING